MVFDYKDNMYSVSDTGSGEMDIQEEIRTLYKSCFHWIKEKELYDHLNDLDIFV